MHDQQTGATSRVSVANDGSEANGSSGPLANTPDHDSYLSADGSVVAFASAASNLVSGDTNGAADIFVRDRQASTTTRVSVDSAGAQSNADSFLPTMTPDGRFIAYGSLSSNLVENDTNGVADVFVHDRDTGLTTRMSLDGSDFQGNGHSSEGDAGFEGPVMSSDGLIVSFASFASNLVPGDTNAVWDIFVRDRSAGSVGGSAVFAQPAAKELDASDQSRGRMLLLIGSIGSFAGIVTLLATGWHMRRRKTLLRW